MEGGHHERRDHPHRPTGRRRALVHRAGRRARAAAARHRAVPEFVHAAGRGPRVVGQADRRGDRRRQGHRRLHPEGSDAGGAGPGRSARRRHADAHPQDVQAARRQPAPDRPGPGAHPARPRDRDTAVPARRGRRGGRDPAGVGRAGDRRARAQHPRELPAGRAAVAGAVRGSRTPSPATSPTSGGWPTSSPRASARSAPPPSRSCCERRTSARGWTSSTGS